MFASLILFLLAKAEIYILLINLLTVFVNSTEINRKRNNIWNLDHFGPQLSKHGWRAKRLQ